MHSYFGLMVFDFKTFMDERLEATSLPIRLVRSREPGDRATRLSLPLLKNELVTFEKVTWPVWSRAGGYSNIDLTVGEGDFVGIVGPSGSGKTHC